MAKQEDDANSIRFRQTKETETLLINFSQNEMNLDDICKTVFDGLNKMKIIR